MDWFDLAELLLELLIELVIPFLAELAADSELGRRFRRASGPSFLLIFASGAAAGAASCVIWPGRLIRGAPLVPGISLVLAPFWTGKAMSWVGDRLRARGVKPTALATFRGGALFGFAMALARFLWVGLR